MKNRLPLLLFVCCVSVIISSCCKENSDCLPQHWVGSYSGMQSCDNGEETIQTLSIVQGDDNFEILVNGLYSSEVCGCKSKLKVELEVTDITFKFKLNGDQLEAQINGTDANGEDLDCEWVGTK